MRADLILPQPSAHGHEEHHHASNECEKDVEKWINHRIDKMREIWPLKKGVPRELEKKLNAEVTAGEIAKTLTHNLFNFQSRGRVVPLIPRAKQNLVQQICKKRPIKIFYLYNGGYRASSIPGEYKLIYEPDQTELLLLYQVALLNEKVSELYSPGIEFFIVLNNGVAHWVNEVPLVFTELYAQKLRNMITWIRAHGTVHVLLQSELAGFDPRVAFQFAEPQTAVSQKEHQIVERFLGRTCSEDEASYRTALYRLAEEKWWEELSCLAIEEEALILRQVAHSEMLSFRAFPGAAIRIQNGTLGFQNRGNLLFPKLITSEGVNRHGIKQVPYFAPWLKQERSAN